MEYENNKSGCVEELLLKLEDNKQAATAATATSDEGGATTITGVLVFSIFIAVCGSFATGCAVGYSSPAQSTIIMDLELTTADYSLFGALLPAGQLIGSLGCGRLTDYLGRRGTLGFSGTLHLTGWVAIAFSQVLFDLTYTTSQGNDKGTTKIDMGTPHCESTSSCNPLSKVVPISIFGVPRAWSLDLGRFTVGLAQGLNTFVAPVYIAEITPKNLRGGAVLFHQLMLTSGVSFVYLVGFMTNWRILALLGAIPCLVQLLGLIVVPESPRWLVKVGDDGGCKANLIRLRGENTDISHEAAEIKEHTQFVENISEDSFLSLFQRKYFSALTVSLGIMAFARFSGINGITFYATTIFESAGFSSAVGTTAMAIVQLPPTILGVFLMDNFGRRPLLLYSAIGMCTAFFSMAFSFLMKEHGWMKDFSPYLALIGFLISSATFSVGLGGIPYLIMAEVFPMNIKGAAGSLSVIVTSLSATTVSYTFNFLMDWSSSGTLFIYACINGFCVLFISILVPETKGRTLEEIQDSL